MQSVLSHFLSSHSVLNPLKSVLYPYLSTDAAHQEPPGAPSTNPMNQFSVFIWLSPSAALTQLITPSPWNTSFPWLQRQNTPGCFCLHWASSSGSYSLDLYFSVHPNSVGDLHQSPGFIHQDDDSQIHISSPNLIYTIDQVRYPVSTLNLAWSKQNSSFPIPIPSPTKKNSFILSHLR